MTAGFITAPWSQLLRNCLKCCQLPRRRLDHCFERYSVAYMCATWELAWLFGGGAYRDTAWHQELCSMVARSVVRTRLCWARMLLVLQSKHSAGHKRTKYLCHDLVSDHIMGRW